MLKNKECSKIPNLPDFGTFGVTWMRVFLVNSLFCMVLADSFSKRFRLRKYAMFSRSFYFPNPKSIDSLVWFWEIWCFCTKIMILCKKYIHFLSKVSAVPHDSGSSHFRNHRNPYYRECLFCEKYHVFDAPKCPCTSNFVIFIKPKILMCARDIDLKKISRM